MTLQEQLPRLRAPVRPMKKLELSMDCVWQECCCKRTGEHYCKSWLLTRQTLLQEWHLCRWQSQAVSHVGVCYVHQDLTCRSICSAYFFSCASSSFSAVLRTFAVCCSRRLYQNICMVSFISVQQWLKSLDFSEDPCELPSLGSRAEELPSQLLRQPAFAELLCTHLRRAIVVRRFSGGVAPSKTKMGRTRWNNSLQANEDC